MDAPLYIGLMSGTSLDGVDGAIVKFDQDKQPVVIKTAFIPYPAGLKSDILLLQHPSENELEKTALISNQLALLYADVVNKLLDIADLSADKIKAIGCHGQTIRHRPEAGFTMQIGNAALLAELTGITVISDFRSRDVAAGGQGAPLVPAFHRAVFGHDQTNRAIINIGGIANITYLAASGETFGFDSGPGNMLLDAWTKQHLGLDYDADGAWSATGVVIEPLLNKMLEEDYFVMMPPKSTGRDLFNTQWLNRILQDQSYHAPDIARTLLALTARSIQQALSAYCNNVDEIYLCGGGAKNHALVSELQQQMPEIAISMTDKLGIGIDWAEAIAFAWLAKQCIEQKTANLPEVTGAAGPRILGAIYQA